MGMRPSGSLSKGAIMAIKNYFCKLCSTLVQKDSSPNTSGCPSGSHHNWRDLGEIGPEVYL